MLPKVGGGGSEKRYKWVGHKGGWSIVEGFKSSAHFDYYSIMIADFHKQQSAISFSIYGLNYQEERDLSCSW